jgi:putative flavoprotein involved in K+ transport
MHTVDTVDTVVVGAGHAGLAVSRLLTDAVRDHVVLDRGEVGERWRSERWDSLHLLTPSWMSRLPGWYYTGPEPEGFLSADRFVRHLERYAASFGAPVRSRTTVERVVAAPGPRYDVHTDRGTWRTRNVVVATGPHGVPRVPVAPEPAGIDVVSSNGYKNPRQLRSGGVLVVGASSSGVQIADELSRAGREVTLAVGRHTRMPRRYRGMDVFWWLESTGRLSRTIDEVADAATARKEPSLQLRGANDPDRAGADLDLAVLLDQGVRLTGRLEGLRDGRARFGDGLADTVRAADRQLHRFLDAVDRHVEATGLASEVLPSDRPRPFAVPAPPDELHLAREGITTVLLATGFRPDHSWLGLPVTGDDGTIEQYRGVTAAPGLYVVGQRFQHRRDSGFIDGARHDAHAVVAHLTTGTLPVPSYADTVGSEEAAS